MLNSKLKAHIIKVETQYKGLRSPCLKKVIFMFINSELALKEVHEILGNY